MKQGLKKQVMSKIKKGEIKKRSQIFFKIIKVTIFAILGVLAVVTIYSINLSFYLPKRIGLAPTPGRRILGILEIIPWPLIIIGIVALGAMIYIYRKYEGGYKMHLKWIIIIASVVALISGYVVSASNLNERLDQRPGIRKFHDFSEEQFVPKRRNLRELPVDDREVRGKFHKN